MSDIVIRARDLRKVYRLYSGPGYRFLDIVGLLGNRPGAYTEHAALDGINLEIRRGEKVAFIGRNGAGKSTLLKLITKVIDPTAGTLEVEGKAHALLQIGTGFHPDFTGRENVFSYLAQLGVTGAEAERKHAEIVEFAELEEYIDQPVKTYSSGMAVRLMFATSTAITPDLLVLDEVLGVGDAYFARKSYERIRELCDRQATTLLLVSHDVYSASKICDRMVWIDRGRIMADLPPADTLKLYEDAVRVQEESRLRKKSHEAIRRSLESADGPPTGVVSVDVAFADTRPSAPLYVARLAIRGEERLVAEVAPADPESRAAVLTEGTAWGDVLEWEGRACRPLQHFGSVFNRAAAVMHVVNFSSHDRSSLQVEVELGAAAPTSAVIRAIVDGAETQSSTVHIKSGWQTLTIPLFGDSQSAPAVRDVIGTGAIVITGARVLNGAGETSPWLTHGEPAALEFDYELRELGLAGPLDFAVSVLRGGVETACRFFTREIHFDGARSPKGTVRMSLPSLMLGVGRYSVIVMVTRLGYADEEGHVFYSINPGVYACVRDILEFDVKGGNLFATGTPVVAPAIWQRRDAQASELK